MRTTLDIADDVLSAVKQRARQEKRTTGEILSDLARRALMTPDSAGTSAEAYPFCGFTPLPHRGRTVSNEIIDHLREETLE